MSGPVKLCNDIAPLTIEHLVTERKFNEAIEEVQHLVGNVFEGVKLDINNSNIELDKKINHNRSEVQYLINMQQSLIEHLYDKTEEFKVQIDRMKVWMYITWGGILCAGLAGVIW